MIRRHHARRRGFGMLGLMGLIVVLATFSTIVLDRSLEAYRAGAQLEWRLQARAAAEGAAALLARDPTQAMAPQRIGVAIVSAPAAAGEDGAATVRLEVLIRPDGSPEDGSRDRHRAAYLARYARAAGAWRLLAVEEARP